MRLQLHVHRDEQHGEPRPAALLARRCGTGTRPPLLSHCTRSVSSCAAPEHPAAALEPGGRARADLVAQVIAAGEKHGVQLLAENALEGGIYNADALERMAAKAKHFDRCARLFFIFYFSK